MKEFNMWMMITIIAVVAFIAAAVVGIEREKTAQMAIERGLIVKP